MTHPVFIPVWWHLIGKYISYVHCLIKIIIRPNNKIKYKCIICAKCIATYLFQCNFIYNVNNISCSLFVSYVARIIIMISLSTSVSSVPSVYSVITSNVNSLRNISFLVSSTSENLSLSNMLSESTMQRLFPSNNSMPSMYSSLIPSTGTKKYDVHC